MSPESTIVSPYFSKTYSFVYDNASPDLACFYSKHLLLKTREQFGKPINSFQAIQWKLADRTVELDAAELLTLRAAWLESHKKPYEKEAATAKM